MIHPLIISLPIFVCGLLSVELTIRLSQKRDCTGAFLLTWPLTATMLSLAFSCFLVAVGQVELLRYYSLRDIECNEVHELALTEVPSPIPSTAPEQEPPLLPSFSPGKQLTTSLPAAQKTASPTLTQRLRTPEENERLFLQPYLKFKDPARQLGANRTYLLNAVKQNLQMTFTKNINRQRIAYAEELMRQHPDRRKADIAPTWAKPHSAPSTATSRNG